MSDQAIQKTEDTVMNIDGVENALLQGDLSKLSATERKNYYRKVCESVGLNPLTKPFEYIHMNGELQLYAKRDAAEQLRQIHNISVIEMQSRKDKIGGTALYLVRVVVQNGEGRTDRATGVVNVNKTRGDNLANAIMKAETKAKRRATLSICGLGWLDETELETIPSVQTAKVDHETGEIEELPESEPEPTGSSQSNEATEKQIKFIKGLANQKGIDKEFLRDLAANICGKRDATELTKNEASELIDELQDLPDKDESEDPEADLFEGEID